MAANSSLRKIIKFCAYPLLNQRTYGVLQGISKAWDIVSGNWSEPELALIPKAVKPGDIAIDMGANYGLYTYPLSKAVGKTGTVYAFEPVPFTFKTLKFIGRLLRFKNVILIEKGCGNKNERVLFTLPIQQSSGAISGGLSHMASRNNQRANKEIHFKYSKTETILCDVVRVDDEVEKSKNISLIKIDIEGAEYFALLGAKELIDYSHPTVICEINQWFLEGYEIKLETLIHFFTDRGYEIYRMLDNTNQLTPVDVNRVEEDNYVFIHPQRKADFKELF